MVFPSLTFFVGIEFENELIKHLTKLGLTESEAKIYLLLLVNPNSTAKILSKFLGVSIQRVYKILQHLQIKGLVFISYSNPKKFSAVPPHIATSILTRKYEENFFEALKTREIILNKVIDSTKFKNVSFENLKNMFYEITDRRTLRSVINERVIKSKKEIAIITTRNDLIRIVYESKSLFKDAKRRGVNIFIISPIYNVEKEIADEVSNWGYCKHTEGVKSRIYIFDGESALLMPSISLLKNGKNYDCGIFVLNSDISDTLRLLFFETWNSL